MKKKYVIIPIVVVGIILLINEYINPTWSYMIEGEILAISESHLEVQTIYLNKYGEPEKYLVKNDENRDVYDKNGKRIDFSELSKGDQVKIIYENRRNKITGKNKYNYLGNGEFLKNVVEIRELYCYDEKN